MPLAFCEPSPARLTSLFRSGASPVAGACSLLGLRASLARLPPRLRALLQPPPRPRVPGGARVGPGARGTHRARADPLQERGGADGGGGGGGRTESWLRRRRDAIGRRGASRDTGGSHRNAFLRSSLVGGVLGWRLWAPGARGPACCRRRRRPCPRLVVGVRCEVWVTGLGRGVGWTGCRTYSPAVTGSMRRSDAQLGAQHGTSDRSPPCGPSAARGCVPELRAPSRVWDPAALSAGDPQGRSREVTSYLCDRQHRCRTCRI